MAARADLGLAKGWNNRKSPGELERDAKKWNPVFRVKSRSLLNNRSRFMLLDVSIQKHRDLAPQLTAPLFAFNITRARRAARKSRRLRGRR
jgi:hypothetical protein